MVLLLLGYISAVVAAAKADLCCPVCCRCKLSKVVTTSVPDFQITKRRNTYKNHPWLILTSNNCNALPSSSGSSTSSLPIKLAIDSFDRCCRGGKDLSLTMFASHALNARIARMQRAASQKNDLKLNSAQGGMGDEHLHMYPFHGNFSCTSSCTNTCKQVLRSLCLREFHAKSRISKSELPWRLGTVRRSFLGSKR